jgi:spermidine/putrescine transport system permease protein
MLLAGPAPVTAPPFQASLAFNNAVSETCGQLRMNLVLLFDEFDEIYASLEKLDLSLLEAAEVLGARPAARFLRVTLQLSLPGVVAGCLLVFVPALGSFLTADLLGGAKQLMIGNLVQNQFSAARNWPFGSAASFVVTALVLAAVMIYLRVRDRAPGGAV